MHLSELEKINKKAYDRYVDMLIEDCADEFKIEDGKITVTNDEGTNGFFGGWEAVWNGDDPQRCPTSVIGDGWESPEYTAWEENQ